MLTLGRNASFLVRLLALFLLHSPLPAQELPPQKVHRQDFEPADDRVFSVITQFYDFDSSLPLDARVVDEWETGEIRNQKLVFTTQSGERVPGRLALPTNAPTPYPCALLLHGLGSSRDRWWEQDREALPRELLQKGIAVFAIDLKLHGERSAANDYQSPVYLTLGNTLFTRSRDMLIDSTIDARRALNYLAERQEIDPKRLAVMGYSMGGMISIFLSALERDLAAAVASAVPTTEQPLPIDHYNFAARAGAPILLQIGNTDWLSSPQDAKKLFGLVPVEGGKLIFYKAGHRLPATFAADAASWLTEKLASSER